MTEYIEDLEYYSNRENFFRDSIYDYLPEAEEFKTLSPMANLDDLVKDTAKALAYSFKIMHFLLWMTPELWPVFLASVEDGFLKFEEQGLSLTGDTRLKMLFASYISGILLEE